jgi:hypothetical protein
VSLPDLATIQALAHDDMAAVDALIRHRLTSDVVLINQVAEYIIGAGGKRLRPMLLLLAAGSDDVFGDLVDQHHIRSEAMADQCVDRGHVVVGECLDHGQVGKRHGRGAQGGIGRHG